MKNDANGLRLSREASSGYFMTSERPDGRFVAYAYVLNPDLQEAKLQFDRDRGPLTDERFYHLMTSVLGLSTHDDVRDAAFVAQEFYRNLDDNLLDLLVDGDESVIAAPPARGWAHPAVRPPEREKRTRKCGPRLTAQTALLEAINGGGYRVACDDMAGLRKAVERGRPSGNEGFRAAAREALEGLRLEQMDGA